MEDEAQRIREEFTKVLSSRHRHPVPVSLTKAKSSDDVPRLEQTETGLPVIRLSPNKAQQQLQEERLVLVTEAGEQGELPVLVIKQLVENGESKRWPAVLILHSSYKSKEHIRPLMEYFARHGYIAVSIDSRYHGERASCKAAYQNAMVAAWKTGEEMPFIFDTVWDVMKLMDYLSEREDIDEKRIGMTGVSLGGMITLYSVAGDCRFAAAVPMIGVQNFSWAVENNKWQARVDSIPDAFQVAAKDLGKTCVDSEVVQAVWKKIAPGLMHTFDVQHILKAVAPRPLLILNGKEDPRCPVEGLEPCIHETAQLYKQKGFSNHFQFVAEENVGHWITESMLVAAKNWFDKFL